MCDIRVNVTVQWRKVQYQVIKPQAPCSLHEKRMYATIIWKVTSVMEKVMQSD